MPLRIALLLFSILGITAIFLPWLHFPKANMNFYGYKADGVVTGFLFFVTLTTSIFTFKKHKINFGILGLIGLIGLLVAFITYHKIIAMDIERQNFGHENVLVVEALAGTELGIGVYLSGLAGLCLFIITILILLEQYFFKSEKLPYTSQDNVKKFYGGILIASIVLGGLGYGIFKIGNRPLDTNAINANITTNVTAMGEALTQGNYDEFLTYNHPVMVNATGGKIKMKQAIEESINILKESGLSIKAIKVKLINDIQQDRQNVQAILTQEVEYDNKGEETTEEQKMLAISTDRGKSFKFINITNKTKPEISKFYPDIIPTLNF